MQPGRERQLVTGAILLGMFLAALEATAVATAVPTAVGELGGVAHYSWVFSAYLLTSTTTVPLFGKLADLFGRKRTYLWSVAIFLIGSALCGVARTFPQLILFRAIQGLGAGGVVAGRHHHHRRHLHPGRARAHPGDLLRDLGAGEPDRPAARRRDHRRPLLALDLLPQHPLRPALRRDAPALHARGDRAAPRTSWTSSARSASPPRSPCCSSPCSKGPAPGAGPIRAPSASSPAPCAGLAVFLWQERRAPEPMLPLDLFQNRLIAVASVGNFLLGALLYALTAYVPMFGQGVLGGSAIDGGDDPRPRSCSAGRSPPPSPAASCCKVDYRPMTIARQPDGDRRHRDARPHRRRAPPAAWIMTLDDDHRLRPRLRLHALPAGRAERRPLAAPGGRDELGAVLPQHRRRGRRRRPGSAAERPPAGRRRPRPRRQRGSRSRPARPPGPRRPSTSSPAPSSTASRAPS